MYTGLAPSKEQTDVCRQIFSFWKKLAVVPFNWFFIVFILRYNHDDFAGVSVAAAHVQKDNCHRYSSNGRTDAWRHFSQSPTRYLHQELTVTTPRYLILSHIRMGFRLVHLMMAVQWQHDSIGCTLSVFNEFQQWYTVNNNLPKFEDLVSIGTKVMF